MKKLTLLVVAFFSFSLANAQDKPIEPAKAVDPNSKQEFLFVQSAKGVTYENGRMTLKGVAPATIFFSDRPARIAGHMTTAEFIPFWSEGKDSFLKDNPNATLSIFNKKGEPTDIVVKLKNPKLEGSNLSYEVVAIQGKLPADGAEATLFIDVIGMPLTPVSYAGAARRAIRY